MLDIGRLESTQVEPTEKRENSSSKLVRNNQLRFNVWVIELLTIFTVLFVVDFLFFTEFGDFFALEPHPFWIPVILLSLQYGFASAVTTAASAIAINWLFLTSEQTLGEPYFSYVIRNSVSPAMWLVTALIIGELRQRQMSLQWQANEEVKRLRGHAEVLSNHCAEAKQANLELQLKIAAGKTAPIEHALIQLGSQKTGSTQQFLPKFEDAMESLIGPHKASVYVINENAGLHLAFQFGWTEHDHFLRRFQLNHPLYQVVIDQKESVSSSRSSWDNQILRGEGEVAVPIQYIHHDKAFGMLKIEEASVSLYSSEKLRALYLLGREMGIFLEQLALETGGAQRDHASESSHLRAAS